MQVIASCIGYIHLYGYPCSYQAAQLELMAQQQLILHQKLCIFPLLFPFPNKQTGRIEARSKSKISI